MLSGGRRDRWRATLDRFDYVMELVRKFADRDSTVWRDQDGIPWTLNSIGTKHAFYIVRMLWNEIAECFPGGLQTVSAAEVMSMTRLNLEEKARALVMMYYEIERRGGRSVLPFWLHGQYEELKTRIVQLGTGLKMLVDESDLDESPLRI